MALGGTQGYTHGLVDMASGHISREIFVNKTIYQQELEMIFAQDIVEIRGTP